MSTVVIRIGGADVTADVIFSSTEFGSQVNGQAGPARLQIRDLNHSYQFDAGQTLTLDIDGVRRWGGWTIKVRPAHAFKVDDTTDAQTTERIWHIDGVDYNILFSKRFLINKATPTKPIPNYPAGTPDNEVVLDVVNLYLDLSGVSISTAGVTHVGSPNPDKAGNIGNPGDPWGSAMSLIARPTGAIFYISPTAVLNYVDVDIADASVGLSDNPVAGQVGFRDMEILRSGSNLANDAMVWGAGTGSINGHVTFARIQDAASIAAHGRWQYGEFTTALYTQNGVNNRANSIVYGSPQNKRGGKDDAISITCTVFDPSFVAGQKVAFESETFSYTDVIPIRRMIIRFPTPTDPEFLLNLSHEIDAPWADFEFWFPKFNFDITFPPITIDDIPGIPPPDIPGGCADCGITDTFTRVVSPTGNWTNDSWGTADSGHVWDLGGSAGAGTGGSSASVNGTDGVLRLMAPIIPAASLALRSYILDADAWVNDFEIVSSFKFEQGPTVMSGDYQDAVLTVAVFEASFTSGALGFGNQYVCILRWSPDSSLTRLGVSTVHEYDSVDPFSSPNVTIEWSSPLTLAIDTYYTIRWQREGLTVRARIWPSTDPEPSAWDLDLPMTTELPSADSFFFMFRNRGQSAVSTALFVDYIDAGVNRCTEFAWDSFERSVTGGWGTNDYGTTYTYDGATTPWSVSSSHGVLTWASGPFAVIATGATDPWRETAFVMSTVVKTPNFTYGGVSGYADIMFQLTTAARTVELKVGSNTGFSHPTGSVIVDGVETDFDWHPLSWYHVEWSYNRTSGVSEVRLWNVVDARPSTPTHSETLTGDSAATDFRIRTMSKSISGTVVFRFNEIDFDYDGRPCYEGGQPPEEESGGVPSSGCESFPAAGTVYTLSRAYAFNSTKVWIDGLRLRQDSDYSETSPLEGIVTLATSAPVGSTVVICSESPTIPGAGGTPNLVL